MDLSVGAQIISRTLTLLILIASVTVSGCAHGPTPAKAPAREEKRVGFPPQWRPGDRWVYRVVGGTESGTKTVEVVQKREVNGIPYYVLSSPDADLINYWTLDLSWAFAVGVRDSTVQARTEPPVPWFTWPLEVGRQWNYKGVYEDRTGKRETNEAFMVVAAETIDVPAGRFETFKIVREGQSVDSDQYWYAPQARSYVRWILKRGEQRVEEELVEYKPAERLIPGSAKTTSNPR